MQKGYMAHLLATVHTAERKQIRSCLCYVGRCSERQEMEMMVVYLNWGLIYRAPMYLGENWADF